MTLTAYFESTAHRAEREQLPLLRALTQRYAEEHPFAGTTVVIGHLLVRNSMVMVQALVRGGARAVLSSAHPTPADREVRDDLASAEVPIYPVAQAVEQGSIYLDVGAVLGRARPPDGAAEVTRTGVLHYERMGVPVVSADNCKAKLIEGFFGTGEGFKRAWRQLRPDDPLRGKRIVQFGYGKIGRGVAWRTREADNRVLVVDPSARARARAADDGFESILADASPTLQRELAEADVIVALTAVPGGIGRSLPTDWLTQGAALVNLGAEDEFGPDVPDELIVGGRSTPLNFYLPRPTPNRYVDPPLAAHLLALEALLTSPEPHPPGVHPLPDHMDRWILRTWREHYPDQDLTGIASDLGLEA